MNRDQLLNNLRLLHTQLSESAEIDPETQSMLETVTSDIQKVLARSGESEGDNGSLSERLRKTLIEFEVRHPQLGSIVESITDSLAGMGI